MIEIAGLLEVASIEGFLGVGREQARRLTIRCGLGLGLARECQKRARERRGEDKLACHAVMVPLKERWHRFSSPGFLDTLQGDDRSPAGRSSVALRGAPVVQR